MASAARAFGASIAAQILLAAIVAIVTSTRLDSNGTCLLNGSGSTCLFIELTCGFSLLFSLLLGVGWWAAARGPTGALHADCGSLAGFAALWWLAAALTATLRGADADGAGLPESSSRGAVIALSWIQLAAFVASWAAVQLDRLARYRARAAARLSAAAEAAAAEADASSTDSAAAGKLQGGSFKKGGTYELPQVLQVPPPAAIVTTV